MLGEKGLEASRVATLDLGLERRKDFSSERSNALSACFALFFCRSGMTLVRFIVRSAPLCSRAAVANQLGKLKSLFCDELFRTRLRSIF